MNEKQGPHADHPKSKGRSGAAARGRLPDLITTRHLARALACSVRTVRRRIRAGELPGPFKVGGINYWRRSTIDAWLRQRERHSRRNGTTG